MIHRNMARRKNRVMSVKVKEDKPLVSEFTRDEIMKMPYMKLRSVAKKNGIDMENLDAKGVRVALIEKLGV